MDDNADAKRILLASPQGDWKRPPRRPSITLLSTIQHDLRCHNLTLPEAVDVAQNRPLWRLLSMSGATQSACQKRRRLQVAVAWWNMQCMTVVYEILGSNPAVGNYVVIVKSTVTYIVHTSTAVSRSTQPTTLC